MLILCIRKATLFDGKNAKLLYAQNVVFTSCPCIPASCPCIPDKVIWAWSGFINKLNWTVVFTKAL